MFLSPDCLNKIKLRFDNNARQDLLKKIHYTVHNTQNNAEQQGKLIIFYFFLDFLFFLVPC